MEFYIAYDNESTDGAEAVTDDLEIVRYVCETANEKHALLSGLDHMREYSRAEEITAAAAARLAPDFEGLRTINIGGNLSESSPAFLVREIQKVTILESSDLNGGGIIRACARAKVEIGGIELFIESAGRFLDTSGPENEPEIQSEADAEVIALTELLDTVRERLK